MYEIYCKAGSVELTREEAEEIYHNKKYVVTSHAIFQPQFSQEEKQIYFTKIASVKGIAPRGRFYRLTANQINDIMGRDYVKED